MHSELRRARADGDDRETDDDRAGAEHRRDRRGAAQQHFGAQDDDDEPAQELDGGMNVDHRPALPRAALLPVQHEHGQLRAE
jgi:hypothetical protein